MSLKEIHKYQEINDFTGKSAGARKHSVSFKSSGAGSVGNVMKMLKVATLVSIVGLGAVTAATHMESPILDFSGMKSYMSEEPKWHSEGPTFQQLFSNPEPDGGLENVSVPIPVHEHDWDSGTVILKASCTEDGTIEFHCKGCDEVKSDVLEATGHVEVAKEGKPATCTEDGFSESRECSVCGVTLTEATVIAAAGHVSIEVEAVEATCTENGHTSGFVCEICGEGLQNTKVTEALGHKFGKIKTVKAATCTEGGVEQKTCSRCGETEITEVAAKGHKEDVISAKAATCEADGRTEGSKCSTCGTVFAKSSVIPALGHDIGTKVAFHSDYDLSESGYPYCTRCGANLCRHEDILQDGDSWEPYCSGEGHVSGTHCYFCGKVFSTGYDIPPTGTHRNYYYEQTHWGPDDFKNYYMGTCVTDEYYEARCDECGDYFNLYTGGKNPDNHPADGRVMVGEDIPGTIPTAYCKYCGATMGY